MSEKSPIIGIDLGTTCCCVGYLNSNKTVDIIENQAGQRVTPSYVAFIDGGEIIGEYAKEKIFRKPENVVYDIKKLIGQKFDSNIMQRIKTYNWPFTVTSNANDTPLIEITSCGKTKKYKPQDISAILLKYMKTIAEDRLDTEVRDAVITVPAYFNYHQRTTTKEAGELAGLNVLKIINEPTAAALAYIHKNEINGRAINVLVFDLGGGTFDVSIVTAKEKSVEVRATAGNTALGGRDFDNNLTEFIADKIEKLHHKKIKTNIVTMRRILERNEKLKIRLSFQPSADFELDKLIEDKDVAFLITRSDFDQINSQLFQICINIVENCLRDAKMSKSEIDKIVLIGGSTRIPKIQEMLTKFFGGKRLTKGINPDEAVAYGAAVQAAMFNKGDKTEVEYEINDVTPFSLGIRESGGLMSVIIPRNSKIPISKTKSYDTVQNNQRSTAIAIYEGEHSLVQCNTLIGRTVLNLPPKPPGYSFVITFYINANGILEVSAKTADGDYTSLAIKYVKPNNHTTGDTQGKGDKIKIDRDNKIRDAVERWIKLKSYCTKMKALCDYDKRGITEKEKMNVRNICKEVTIWLNNNEVRDGSPREEVAILDKSEKIERVCEPITNSYGYYVKDMHLDEFHELVNE